MLVRYNLAEARIFYSDRGIQYTSKDVLGFVRSSMGRCYNFGQGTKQKNVENFSTDPSPGLPTREKL
jgi:transposase InsO family protein